MPWQSQRQGTELYPSDLKELMHTPKCFFSGKNKTKQKHLKAGGYIKKNWQRIFYSKPQKEASTLAG